MKLRTDAKREPQDYEINGVEFIQALLDAGAITPDQTTSIARAWGVEEERITHLHGEAGEGRVDWAEVEYQVRIHALTFAQVIENRGLASNVALLSASREDLEDFKGQYEAQARRLFGAMVRREERHGRLDMSEDTPWCKARAKLEVVCYKLWQAKQLLGEA